ncbi:GNAT family N-acetyltransferase [Desulfoluna spongiiphila]|uniref:Maltose O-acetyltransferase n=1 Tax=Desulfoluna spongiiphila TaxID=419481 RepID=A0A1G5J9D0_9BACT|nr:GNAT family N-acetyltransferase [Desulfoluna spongiiphila]SCY84983.1 maltose O-acetyltransferase [Desulfoluna spongiiphila]
MTIRKATPDDSNELTDISFMSKKHWNYPDHYFDIWNAELTITPEYVQKNHVFVIEDSGIRGFYSVIKLQTEITLSEFTMRPGTWLDHVFIRPEYIGMGYGRSLMGHLAEQSQTQKWAQIQILADPNSRNFYKKMGVSYIKEVPSNIENRTVSYFIWNQPFSIP